MILHLFNKKVRQLLAKLSFDNNSSSSWNNEQTYKMDELSRNLPIKSSFGSNEVLCQFCRDKINWKGFFFVNFRGVFLFCLFSSSFCFHKFLLLSFLVLCHLLLLSGLVDSPCYTGCAQGDQGMIPWNPNQMYIWTSDGKDKPQFLHACYKAPNVLFHVKYNTFSLDHSCKSLSGHVWHIWKDSPSSVCQKQRVNQNKISVVFSCFVHL